MIEHAANAAYSPNGFYVTQNRNAASVQAQGVEAENAWRISVETQYAGKTAWTTTVLNGPDAPGKIVAKPNIAANLLASYPVSQNLDVYADAQNLFDRVVRRPAIRRRCRPKSTALRSGCSAVCGWSSNDAGHMTSRREG